jgi:hypothetical protein
MLAYAMEQDLGRNVYWTVAKLLAVGMEFVFD